MITWFHQFLWDVVYYGLIMGTYFNKNIIWLIENKKNIISFHKLHVTTLKNKSGPLIILASTTIMLFFGQINIKYWQLTRWSACFVIILGVLLICFSLLFPFSVLLPQGVSQTSSNLWGSFDREKAFIFQNKFFLDGQVPLKPG